MRPGREWVEVAVLDRRQELEVILTETDQTNSSQSYREFINRFYEETRWSDHALYQMGQFYSGPLWMPEASFGVRLDEIDFVKEAAERVLEEKSIVKRAFNFVKGRTNAAKTILDFFEA